MHNFIKTLYLFFFLSIGYFSIASVCDSVESRSINGKQTIIHKVEKGETFYALSKRYHLTVEQIKKANGNIETLGIGTLLKLPNNTFVPTQAEGTTHIVKPKETLFAIARQHKISVRQVQEWNHLSSYAINVGQTLIVAHGSSELDTPTKTTKISKPKGIYHTVQKGETLYSVSKKYSISVRELKDWNNIKDGTGISIGTKLVVNHGSNLETHKANRTDKLISKKLLLKVNENETMNSNMAECLYDGAAEGDIIKITHTASQNIVFVRVAGHIKDKTRAKVIINTKAAEQLAVTDNVFHVIVTEVH